MSTLNKSFFFSIIIPLYNKEKYIESTLMSVLNQSFQDFEVIIVDDGSTDKSYQIASKFENNRIKLLKQINQGVSVARNLGIQQAQSKYIALLDADDLWYENHLFELKKQILLFPKIGLYCNNYEVFLKENLSRKASFNFEYNQNCLIVEDYFKASIINSVAWTSSVCFSKENFNKIGKFNTYLKTAQDLDLWIRFALQYKVSFNPTITMSYKLYVHGSLSKNEFNHIRYHFINNYSEEEKLNSSLKLYLDINRYAVAVRCKMNNQIELYKKFKKQISYTNLNFKQKTILYAPRFVIKFFKGFQRILIRYNIYINAHS